MIVTLAAQARAGGEGRRTESRSLLLLVVPAIAPFAGGDVLMNYGRQTPLVALLAHVAYGMIVGAFVSAAG